MRPVTRFNNIRRSAKINYLTIQRWVSFQLGTGSDAVTSFSNGNLFKLSDLPNHTEFTSLFDQYMIAGIKYRFLIRTDPNSTGAAIVTAANRGVYPVLMWVHDHDDSSAPANKAELQQYSQCREMVFSGERPHTRWFYLKPAIANEVFGTGITVAYQPKWRQYLDNAYPGIAHYGLRWNIDNFFAGQQLFLECKYVLKLKGVV